MVKASTIKKVLHSYYDLQFPHSYGGLRSFFNAFREAYPRIKISFTAMKHILQSDVIYQTHKVRPSGFLDRSIYSLGTGIEAYIDTAATRFGETHAKTMYWLIAQDIFSKFCYTTYIPEGPKINTETMTKALQRLFRQGLPKFNIVRSDLDSVFAACKPLFAKRGSLLQVRRGEHFLSILDSTIKQFEKKLSQFFLRRPNANPEKALKAVTKGYNGSTHSRHTYAPAQVNSPLFDPILRRIMFPDHKELEPFDKFLRRNLRLQEEVNEPSLTKNLAPGFKWREWRVGDRCIINFSRKMALARGYNVKRGLIMEIAKIFTQFTPYIYQLRYHSTKKILPGYYGANELFRVPDNVKFLKEKIIAKVRRRRQYNRIIKYKNLPMYVFHFSRAVTL